MTFVKLCFLFVSRSIYCISIILQVIATFSFSDVFQIPAEHHKNRLDTFAAVKPPCLVWRATF
jgi:hypothetical protein